MCTICFSCLGDTKYSTIHCHFVFVIHINPMETLFPEIFFSNLTLIHSTINIHIASTGDVSTMSQVLGIKRWIRHDLTSRKSQRRKRQTSKAIFIVPCDKCHN